MGSGGLGLALKDFGMSFMWVWAGVLSKIFVHKILGLGYYDLKAELLRYAVSITYMFFFAYLGKVSKGAAYNPLSLLSSAISGSFLNFLFIVGVRIPAQVFGSIVGVKLILDAFPEIGRGPRLNIDIHRGALTEGLLTFVVVFISLSLARNLSGSFYRKTWISSVSKLSLHTLGADLTGGCMSPASVMGWAYARGDHMTKEHILVYWLAPMEATLLAAWVFKLISRPVKVKESMKREKSD